MLTMFKINIRIMLLKNPNNTSLHDSSSSDLLNNLNPFISSLFQLYTLQVFLTKTLK